MTPVKGVDRFVGGAFEVNAPAEVKARLYPSTLLSWPGMELLRASCLGIVLVEIDALVRDEKGLLTPREADRAEKLGSRRRALFLGARLALKALARRLGAAGKDTADSVIETLGPDGVRPCLGESGLYCSVSHTDRLVVAVGHPQPVGVDIEAVSSKSLRVWHLFMPSVSPELLSTSGMEPERAATRAWTIKEAATKAFGLDLSEAIREVDIVQLGERESAIRHSGNTYSVRHAEGEGHVLSLLTCGGF